jgi:hypothetical protein
MTGTKGSPHRFKSNATAGTNHENFYTPLDPPGIATVESRGLELEPQFARAAPAIAKLPLRRPPGDLRVFIAAGVEGVGQLLGTANEHPNWRRKVTANVKDIAKTELFRDITDVVSQERPRQQ